jgi:hypothetical protein
MALFDDLNLFPIRVHLSAVEDSRSLAAKQHLPLVSVFLLLPVACGPWPLLLFSVPCSLFPVLLLLLFLLWPVACGPWPVLVLFLLLPVACCLLPVPLLLLFLLLPVACCLLPVLLFPVPCSLFPARGVAV